MKGKRKVTSLLVYAIILLAIFLGLYKILEKPAEAAWYDESWAYRIRITINNSGAAVTNQKVKQDIATDALVTAGKIQSDCGDSRFTDQGGDPLRYYIDTAGGACNTNSTDYYILLPNINAGATIIYHYYGNPSATNGTETAQFAEATFSPQSTASASEEKSEGPVAYWKFDEGTGTTAQDSSQNNIDGTLTSGPVWKTEDACISGKCLQFDGSATYVNLPDAENLKYTEGFSVSMWFYGNSFSTPDAPELFRARVTGTNKWVALRIGYNNELEFNVRGETNDIEINSPNNYIEENKWYHATAAYNPNATPTTTLFVNGQRMSDTSNSNAGTITPNGDATIGMGFNSWKWNGRIDEVKIYNYARTTAQAKTDFSSRGKGSAVTLGSNTQNQSSLNNGLIGYWKMDETAENSCGSSDDNCDSSGNGNNGDWTSTFTSAAGKFGNAGSFDGGTRYMDIGDPAIYDFGSNNFTVSAWVYRTTTTAYDGTAFSKWNIGSSPGTNEWYINHGACVIATDTIPCFGIESGSTPYTAISPDVTSNNTWYHLVGMRDGSTIKLYVDGTLKATTNIGTASVNNISGRSLKFARIDGGSYGLTGSIDEARIYNRALTNQEVTQLYNFAPGPVGYWKMDESSWNGTTSEVVDSSGNGIHGTSSCSGGGCSKPNTTSGKFGRAGAFTDGGIDVNGQYVNLSSSSLLAPGTGSYTVSTWIKYNGDSCGTGGCGIFGTNSGYAGSNNGLSLLISSAGLLRLMVNDGTNLSDNNFGTPTTNTWQYITITLDKNNNAIKAYVNGISTLSTTFGTVTGSINNAGAHIGSRDSNSYTFNGSIDDLKVYNYARTQKQIVADMNAGHPNVGSPVGSALAHYKFDEGVDNTCIGGANDVCNFGSGGSTLDGAGSGFSSPATSTSGWTTNGKYNKGLIFDGSNDYVSISDNDALDFGTGSITITSWIKTSNVAGSRPIVEKRADSPVANPGYSIGLLANGHVYGVIQDGTNKVASSDTADDGIVANDNAWHHIAVTFNRGGNVIRYVDGKKSGAEVSIATVTGSVNNSSNLNIARFNGGPTYLEATIDEVKIYNFALTDDEIKLDYNRGSSIVLGTQDTGSKLADGTGNAPVAEWKMDEKIGQTLFDKSGNTNNATLGANSSIASDDPVWTDGKYGSALLFDGSNDYTTVADSSSLRFTESNPFTIDAWFNLINPDFSNSIEGVVVKRFSNDRYWITVNTGYIVQAQVSDGTNTLTADSTTVVSQNQWNHAVLVYDGANNLRLYLNGKLEATDTSPTLSGLDTTGANLEIGRESNNNRYFNGKIDNVRVFNYARTQAQIAQDFNRGVPVGWWKMDECQGSTVYDFSPNANGGYNGNNGTINPGDSSGDNDTVGSCNSGTSTEMWNDGTTGKRNSSLGFDGTNDYVSMATGNTITGTSAFSLSGWLKPGSHSTYGLATMIGNAVSDQSAYIGWVHTAQQGTSSSLGGGFYGTNYGSGITDLTNWHHVVLTFAGGTGGAAVLYVDGIARVSTTHTPNLAATAIRFGSANTGTNYWYNGLLDDVRIYNYALSPTQIKEIYNNGTVNFGP